MTKVKTKDLSAFTNQDWVKYLDKRSFRGHKINKMAINWDSCTYDNSTYQLKFISKKGKKNHP